MASAKKGVVPRIKVLEEDDNPGAGGFLDECCLCLILKELNPQSEIALGAMLRSSLLNSCGSLALGTAVFDRGDLTYIKVLKRLIWPHSLVLTVHHRPQADQFRRHA